MANFFLDNQDIMFLFDYIDLEELAEIQELDTPNGDSDYVPDTSRGHGRQLPPNSRDHRRSCCGHHCP